MVKAWIWAGSGVLGLAAPTIAAAPAPANAAIASEMRAYRFDLSRNFFATFEQEIATRSEVEAAIAELDRLADGTLTRARLIEAMAADDRAQRLFRKHDLYLFLRFAVDTREEAGMAAADAMRVRLRAARTKLKRAALANGAALFKTGMAAGADIERYRYWYDQARREADHLLPVEQQQVIDSLDPLLGGVGYPQLVRNLQFAPVMAGGRKLDPRRDQAQLEADKSPAIREAAAHQLFAGYWAKRDQFADLLIRSVKGGEAVAKLHRYGGALDEAAFTALVSPGQYRALLTEVARNAATFKDWQRRVRDPFARSAHWSPNEAAAMIANSAKGIAPAYAAEFAQLLDPTNGRADLAGPGPRVPIQGTASVYPIGVSAIYMQNYQGDLLDLIILAHESGHAVQAQLMFRAGVPMIYAAGPGYFTESFGRFQELVLLDQLYRTANGSKRVEWLRDALAARLLSVFNSAEEAAVELALHDAVNAGSATGADDLDAVTAKASAAYSTQVARNAETRGMWMLSDGYYLAPYQELNDAFASLLAVRYYAMYRRDPTQFGPAYMALLSGGYGDAPNALLSRNLGIDMTDPDFAGITLAALRGQIDELYRSLPEGDAR
ncbi:MAG: hypothetical protein ABIS38_05295 [Sphingomicrobium sp.]